jgi:ATP-dependent RNA helicase RhlE
MSKQTFADLGLSAAVCGALAKRGITEPFAIQRLVIRDILDGRDVLAKSPTGSGKTLAFGLPLVERLDANMARRPSALVLAPTRELAIQIVEELRPLAHARALKVALAYGGVGIAKQEREASKAHLLVATPGRLEDLLQRRSLTLDHVRLLVLDEADRMLDMGFRPAVDRIVARCAAKRQTLFFSATLDGTAGEVARSYTHDAARHEHAPPPRPASEVEHRFVAVERATRIDALLEELRDERDRALVFVRTKRGADRLTKRLVAAGVRAVAMHGDKTQGQRERALRSFDSGDADVLVATDVAARGLDVDGISHVINFDPPEDREGYVHRVGRTARAGRTGAGITLVHGEVAADVEKLAAELELHREYALSGLATTRREPSRRDTSRGPGREGSRGGRSGGGRRRRRSGTR